MIDSVLEVSIHDYLLYRKQCFNNFIPYVPNSSFDKIINARYGKISRIKKRFLYLISHRRYVYFITFTFDDDLLNKCDRTKKDSCKDSLTSFDNDILIIMNRDFGGQFGREHYHAIVGTDNSNDLYLHLKNHYPCIFYKENVLINCLSIKKLSKYINKLSNHCLKDSTKNSRMYFNFKGYDDPNLDPVFYNLAKQLFMSSH